MAAWLPVLKAALPYVAQIVTAAIPAFTAKSDVTKTDPLIVQQIEELQAAATKNAESIHLLAEKLQQTIQGIESGAIALQKQLVMFKLLLVALLFISVVALAIAAWVMFH